MTKAARLASLADGAIIRFEERFFYQECGNEYQFCVRSRRESRNLTIAPCLTAASLTYPRWADHVRTPESGSNERKSGGSISSVELVLAERSAEVFNSWLSRM